MQQDWGTYKLGVQYEAVQEWITQITGALLSLQRNTPVSSDQVGDDITVLTELKRELTVKQQALADARNVVRGIMAKWKIL